jgi:glycolate oxidase iron-sulfur subunit
MGLKAARIARPLRPLLPTFARRMLDQAPARRLEPSPTRRPQVFPAQGEKKMRVALLAGCVQQVLGAEIDAATLRVLTRHGCEVVVAQGSGCCGAVALHMGHEDGAREHARRNVAAWQSAGGIDAVVINASGCGSTVKDYARLLADDPLWSRPASEIAARARDVTELLADLKLHHRADGAAPDVALHLPCSQQHGQGITVGPRKLLQDAGFRVLRPVESHMCCGAAGTYNLLQPQMSDELGERKAKALEATGAAVISSGNMGCMLHLARRSGLPVVHTVQLIDWATGGPVPPGLESRVGAAA